MPCSALPSTSWGQAALTAPCPACCGRLVYLLKAGGVGDLRAPVTHHACGHSTRPSVATLHGLKLQAPPPWPQVSWGKLPRCGGSLHVHYQRITPAPKQKSSWSKARGSEHIADRGDGVANTLRILCVGGGWRHHTTKS